MPLNIPENAQDIESRSKADVQSNAPSSNPFLKNSWLSALINSFSNRIFDFYINLESAVKETFFDTSTGAFLERQASWFGIERLKPQQSGGNIIVTGAVGSEVPAGTEFRTTDGIQFTTDNTGTVNENIVGISDLAVSGGIATANTVTPHNLTNGVSVVIDGSLIASFNGTFTVTGVDEDTFTYELNIPANVATGVITATFNIASIPVTSDDSSSSTNLDKNTKLIIANQLAGIDDSAGVDANGMAGGADLESDKNLRARFLFRVQNPVAHFNEADIANKCFEIAGVTRVFVFDITPDVGQVTIYFMRDNDTNPIPSGAEINQVKDNILTIKPANTSDNDIIVLAPTAVPVDFTFSALSPNTTTMRNSIINELSGFFSTRADVGENITEDAYRSTIFQTLDSETGERVENFTLDDPVGDVVIATGEIATLGNVNFI